MKLLHELYSFARTKNFDLLKHMLKNIDLICAKLPAEKRQPYFDQNDY
jgi:hypothetical protein